MEKTISRLQFALKWMVVLLIIKVTITIVSNYVQYIPPNFQSDFLIGRERYFFGVYSVAFYAHILASPLTIVSGLVLLNRQMRGARPQLHRRLGQVHLMVVLFLVVPSGLVMSRHALNGWTAVSDLWYCRCSPDCSPCWLGDRPCDENSSSINVGPRDCS